jgi:hypothetical protein
MTFYGILFGVLFLGAVRELFMSIAAGDSLRVAMALILGLLVFNDTLYTSQYVESDHGAYTANMKLLDLASFLSLATALIVSSPQGSVFLDRPISVSGPRALLLFWASILLYWILGLTWNRLARRATPQAPPRTTWMTQPLLLPPLVMCLLSTSPHRIVLVAATACYGLLLLTNVVFLKPRQGHRHGKCGPQA